MGVASLTYEMLAGENPFLAPDLERAEAVIEDAELVLPSLCWDELDPAVDDVIFFALDPDREERYATVADFAEELEPFLGDPKRGVRELSVIVGHADDEEFGLPDAGNQRALGEVQNTPHDAAFHQYLRHRQNQDRKDDRADHVVYPA